MRAARLAGGWVREASRWLAAGTGAPMKARLSMVAPGASLRWEKECAEPTTRSFSASTTTCCSSVRSEGEASVVWRYGTHSLQLVCSCSYSAVPGVITPGQPAQGGGR